MRLILATGEILSLKVDILDKIAALITAAFGLVAALAWNSAIQTIFATYFPPDTNGVIGPLVYAIFVTIIAVIMTIWIARVFAKAKKKDEAEAKKA